MRKSIEGNLPFPSIPDVSPDCSADRNSRLPLPSSMYGADDRRRLTTVIEVEELEEMELEELELEEMELEEHQESPLSTEEVT